MNVTGLKSVPRYFPEMVCMTLNESTATPHASGKTKSQPKTNNRKDCLPIWVKLTTTSVKVVRRGQKIAGSKSSMGSSTIRFRKHSA